jgi:Trp operon repressor
MSKTMKNEKMYTLVLTESELELIYDQLNIVELFDSSDENVELSDSISTKIHNLTTDENISIQIDDISHLNE